MMRIGSLFSGIGGLDIGAEWALGGRTIWQADRVGHEVRRRHWPNALQLVGDVAELDPGRLPAVDALVAGFACQDLSVAGQKASGVDLLAGARTGSTYLQVLRFVAELRPDFVVLENVPALLGHRERVEADLAGYGVTWVRCSAADVGAPHLRRRVFALAVLGGRAGGVLEAGPLRQVEGVAWSTPRSSEATRGTDPRGMRQGAPGLLEEVRTWATPLASSANEGINGNGAGEPLGQQVRTWATPRLGAGGNGRAVDGDPDRLEEQVVGMWPTPTQCGNQNRKGASLTSGDGLETAATSGLAGRRLNPEWVEVLVGLPMGWTRPTGPPALPERAPAWPRGRYPKGWDRSKVWPGHDWEPPRTLPDGPPAPGRPARIRGLGNVAMPQQVAHALAVAMDAYVAGMVA